MRKLKTRKVMAANFHGTYSAGVFEAESDQEAIEMAKESYRRSPIGRDFKDLGAFRFWVTASSDD